MMRSLFSGVAGLKTHQTKMDVIGNNIANVNTVAYKSQSTTFQELMYQTTQNASGASQDTGRGGVNAKQIGLGSSLAAINTNISTSGSSQSTGNAFDVQISGDSFFIVSDGSQNYFTRAGAFYVDGIGNLAMTSNGYTVQGWQTDDNGDIKIDTVSALKIMDAKNLTSSPEQTTKAYVDGILDKNDANVKTTNGRVLNVSVYDNLGYNYIVQFAIKENGADSGKYTIEPVKITDSNNKVVYPGGTATATLSGTALEFSTSTGSITTPAADADKKNTYTLTIGNMPSFTSTISIDFTNIKMYDNSGTSTIAGHYGDTDGKGAGRKMGSLSGVAIQQNGMIYGSYDNGTTKLLGQIAVASFVNPSGLEKVGDNLYATTQNSGTFDGIGKDITANGGGSMKTGVLEMSNVDLSSEFTEMITTQRGFQANSRIITVSDTMLEELINLKR